MAPTRTAIASAFASSFPISLLLGCMALFLWKTLVDPSDPNEALLSGNFISRCTARAGSEADGKLRVYFFKDVPMI